VKFESGTIRKNSRLCAFLPATSKRMTVDLTVARTVNAPRLHYTGLDALEGVVSADGLRVDFKPGPDAPALGLVTMPVGSITPISPDWSDAATKDWKTLTIDVPGGGDEAVADRLGDIFQAQFLIFPEGGNESAGIFPPWGVAGGGGQGGGKFHYRRNLTWLGSPQMLRPGAKIRVGVFRPAKNDDLKFDLELPELVQPR
jgi:hypothetical protein